MPTTLIPGEVLARNEPSTVRRFRRALACACQLVVDSRHRFDDFAAAFERLESHRAKGKVLLTLDDNQPGR